jgi:hypothetical protein
MLKRCGCCTCDSLAALAVGSVTADLSGLTPALTANCTSPPSAQSLANFPLGASLGPMNQRGPCLFATPTGVNLGVGGRVFDSIVLSWNGPYQGGPAYPNSPCRWELAIYGQNGGGSWNLNQNPPVWVPNPHPLEVIWFGVRAKAAGVHGQFDAQGLFVPTHARGTYTQAGGCATGPATITVS